MTSSHIFVSLLRLFPFYTLVYNDKCADINIMACADKIEKNVFNLKTNCKFGLMSVVQFCQLSIKLRHSFCLGLNVCQWRGMLHRFITIADFVTGLLSYLCTYHSCDINTCGPLQIMLSPNYSESTLWNFRVRDPILWSWNLTIRLTAMVSMSSL